MTFFDFTKSYEKIVKIEKSIVLNLRNRPSLIERDESTSKVAIKRLFIPYIIRLIANSEKTFKNAN